MTGPALPISRVVRRDEVPPDGLTLVVTADARALSALAGLLDIPEVRSLEADLAVAHWGRDGLVVRGRLDAEVVQTCVVTLDPVVNVVSEPIEEHFAPDPQRAGALAALEEETVDLDDIEPMPDGRIDVGAVVVETLSLGLDPYPRKPGVLFEPGGDEAGDEAPPGPFAALEEWKRRGGNG